MKIPKKDRTGKAAEGAQKLKVVPGWTQVRKTTNRTRVHCPEPTGQIEKCFPFLGSTELLCSHEKCRDFGETMKMLHVPEPCSEQTLHPVEKIKLQLFPVDKYTCVGLEKDGYHPYLELTLSSRKKISSVLKHLNAKWGGSSIAIGEPILFLYHNSEHLASYRWTLNDTDIRAGDVYNAIGRPSLFRLRYGWIPYSEAKSSEVPSTSTSFEACEQPEGMQIGCSIDRGLICSKPKHMNVSIEKLDSIVVNGETDSKTDKMSSNGLVIPMDNEVRMDVGVGRPSVLWDDSLTNVSIGGLLSEASLQGMLNNCDPTPSGSSAGLQPLSLLNDNLTTISIGGLLSEASLQGMLSNCDPRPSWTGAGSQPSLLITDSFDAFIAAQVNPLQLTRPLPHGAASATSILDAEDTCHAFPFSKFSSLDKNAAALAGNVCSRASDQVNTQSSFPQGHGHQRSETDLSLRSRVCNDESSLGLSGIKWTDSLGPFDLGPSSSGKIIIGDSLSISRIVS